MATHVIIIDVVSRRLLKNLGDDLFSGGSDGEHCASDVDKGREDYGVDEDGGEGGGLGGGGGGRGGGRGGRNGVMRGGGGEGEGGGGGDEGGEGDKGGGDGEGGC